MVRFLCCLTVCACWLAVIPLRAGAAAGNGARNAADFPGVSIVEKIQAAIRDCGANPCEVYIPAGTYEASPIATWKARDFSGASIGIVLPSNVELRGAGAGHTVIRLTRSQGDPPATLLANADPPGGGRNIRIRDMSLVWTDSSSQYDWVSIFVCHGCSGLELDHLSLEGNPNKLVNLLDCTGSSVHDNTFRLRTTGYGHGDNALGVSRFNPATTVGAEAGVLRANHFTQTGDSRTFSMLIVAQSGLYVHDNVFEGNLPPPGNATGIESGQDNLGRLPENVKISGNIFHRASIAYGGLVNSDISSNFLDHGDIYIALQSGSTSSVAGLTIADNELHFGSIGVSGLEHAFTGRCLVTRNRVWDGRIGVGNRLVDADVEMSYNDVRYSPEVGIDCNACSVIRGNEVRDVGQRSPGDLHPGYLIGGNVEDVSNNLYLEDQQEYERGTVCSVPSASSRSCMTSGQSRWILLSGGEWGFGWTNRKLFTGHGDQLIRAFVSSSLIELEQDAPALPSGTRYRLLRTTFNGFELNNAVIERFADNAAISSTGGFKHAALQEDGTVRIRSLSGNVFRPYSCFGKCATDYRSSVNAPE